MAARSPRSIARSDIIAIACLGGMVGLNFLQGVQGFLRHEWSAWLYFALMVALAGAIVVVARRTLRKIPDDLPQ